MKKHLVIIICGLIFTACVAALAIHNYNYDTSRLFTKKADANTFFCRDNNMNLCIDAQKDVRNEVLFAGGSELRMFFYYKTLINTIAIYYVLSYEELYETMEAYLNIHPEVKKIYFFITYNAFFKDDEKESSFTLKTNNPIIQKIKLLLSFEPVKKHWGQLMNKSTKKNSGTMVYPYKIKNYIKDKYIYDECHNNNMKYLKKIVELCKSKNIEIEFVIPPYNIMTLTTMYLSEEDYYRKMEEVKREVVENYGPIYDFSRINKYTLQNVTDDSNYLFYDPVHTLPEYGIKILNSLLFNHTPENDLYYLQTKDTVENNLKEEREQIQNFIDNNKDYVNDYLEHMNDDWFLYTRFIPDNSEREDIKEDKNFLDIKINEIKNNS